MAVPLALSIHEAVAGVDGVAGQKIELLEKFGEDYRAYRQRVPMLFPNPRCALRVLSNPLDERESVD